MKLSKLFVDEKIDAKDARQVFSFLVLITIGALILLHTLFACIRLALPRYCAPFNLVILVFIVNNTLILALNCALVVISFDDFIKGLRDNLISTRFWVFLVKEKSI